MSLFNFFDQGLVWMVAVAAVGLIAMLFLVLLVVGLKWPATAGFLRRTVFGAATLRGRLLIGLFLIGAIPVMTLPPILTLESARNRQAEMVDELRSDASDLAHSVTRMVSKQIAGVDELAAHINSLDRLDPSTLGDWLLRHHNAHPEFVSTWVARPDGQVVAATAFLEGDQKPWAGPRAGVALMDFFKASTAGGGLYVSRVMKGVPPRYDPMIVISAPIFMEGSAPWGFIQTQLNLRRVYRNVVSYDLIPGRPMFLTDRKNRVMAASPQVRFKTFEDLSGHKVVTEALAGDSTPYEFNGAVEIDKSANYYLAVQRTLESGWRVYAVASLAGMENQAMIYLGLSLLWVLIVGVLAFNLAGMYGGSVDDPLQTLHQSLDVFDSEHTVKMLPMMSKDAPKEIVEVFERMRQSMEKSRDSYRNMLKAIKEGEEARLRLKADAHRRRSKPQAELPPKARSTAAKTAAKTAATGTQAARTKPAYEYMGRWDSLTELAGREVFKEFFGEAWNLGCVDNRPLSLLVFSIGFGEARAQREGGSVEDSVFESAGEALRAIVGRELDLAARLDADKFAVILPDTDVFGGLVVAERARKRIQAVLPEMSGGKALAANVGVAWIAASPNGDATGFIKGAQRVLVAAEKKEGSRIAYVNEDLKISVLEVGEQLPTAPPVTVQSAPAEAPATPASVPDDKPSDVGESIPLDSMLSLEETGKSPAARPAPADEPKPGADSNALEQASAPESNSSGLVLSLEETQVQAARTDPKK